MPQKAGDKKLKIKFKVEIVWREDLGGQCLYYRAMMTTRRRPRTALSRDRAGTYLLVTALSSTHPTPYSTQSMR
jgi:hypothetical protein